MKANYVSIATDGSYDEVPISFNSAGIPTEDDGAYSLFDYVYDWDNEDSPRYDQIMFEVMGNIRSGKTNHKFNSCGIEVTIAIYNEEKPCIK